MVDPRFRQRPNVPWRDIIYFATSVILIAIAAVIAVSLSVEMNNLKDRIEDNEESADEIPDLLEALQKTICDKIDGLVEEINTRLDLLEDRTDELEIVAGEGPFQELDEKAQSDGYAPLDGNAIVPQVHLPQELMEEQGCWDAMTNTPMLSGGGGCDIGNLFVVNTSGSTNLDGNADWDVGDALVCTREVGWKRIGKTVLPPPVFPTFVELSFVPGLLSQTNAAFPPGSGYGMRLGDTVHIGMGWGGVTYSCVMNFMGGVAVAYTGSAEFAMPGALGGPAMQALFGSFYASNDGIVGRSFFQAIHAHVTRTMGGFRIGFFWDESCAEGLGPHTFQLSEFHGISKV